MLTKKDSMIFGVCGGIAHNLCIDPSIVRLTFAILFFSGLAPIGLIYILFAIILPNDPNES